VFNPYPVNVKEVSQVVFRRRKNPAAAASAKALKTARKRIRALERKAKKQAAAILKQAKKDVQRAQEDFRAARKAILADVARRAKRARKALQS
jgi:hypothetical protein